MIDANAALHGKGKQGCSKPRCRFRSLRGMVKGKGLCPFHWAAFTWGTEWAEHCYPHYRAEAERPAPEVTA